MSQEAFKQTLANTKLFALATSVDDVPNVRIMDGLFDTDRNVLVIPTKADSAKVAEFEKNPTVALTTLPAGGPAPIVRIKGAKVVKSDVAIDDIKDTLIEKREGFAHLLAGFGDAATTYEIQITGGVLIDHGNVEVVTL